MSNYLNETTVMGRYSIKGCKNLKRLTECLSKLTRSKYIPNDDEEGMFISRGLDGQFSNTLNDLMNEVKYTLSEQDFQYVMSEAFEIIYEYEEYNVRNEVLRSVQNERVLHQDSSSVVNVSPGSVTVIPFSPVTVAEYFFRDLDRCLANAFDYEKRTSDEKEEIFEACIKGYEYLEEISHDEAVKEALKESELLRRDFGNV